MAKISSIKGITYNLDKVNINDAVAPPYDVISKQEQEELYNSSPYNIVRLILGKVFDTDNEINNKYIRAAEFFKEWLNKNILIKSDKPCIYYYIQKYTASNGELISRKGFIAKTFLEEFSKGIILPHEYTMGGPKEDRFKLMKECEANFSQIFMVYSDPEHEIDKAFELPEKPFIDVTDKQGVRNIVYIIDQENKINKITELMKNKTLLIADGHHRYETALKYRDYMRLKNSTHNDKDEFNWVMSYFTNLDDENLKVYPTHRVITKPVNFEELLENLKKSFSITEFSFEEINKAQVKQLFLEKLENKSKENIVFGIFSKNINNKLFLIELNNKENIDEILEEKNIPKELRNLDLTILHKLIVNDFLGINEEDQMKLNGIKYTKKEEEAFNDIDLGYAEMIFLTVSPKIQDIKEISSKGCRMPQKSTYFYPKLLSGLVINPLE
ncbi:MAG: DUF1015 domain-containing protein [bacterium]